MYCPHVSQMNFLNAYGTTHTSYGYKNTPRTPGGGGGTFCARSAGQFAQRRSDRVQIGRLVGRQAARGGAQLGH